MSVGSTIALVAERILAPAEGMHRDIAKRWFTSLGPIARPVQVAHDGVSTVVYEAIRFGAKAIGRGVEAGIAVDPRTADSVQAYVNGLWGDDLGELDGRLGISMGIRDREGEVVAIGPDLAAAFPAATGRLVVLVHGLIETETCWDGTTTDPGLAQALDDNIELTRVSIRYNTGLSVSGNGSQLASLLESLCSQWPVPVRQIALVGHSLGGLVVCSAIVAGRGQEHRWVGAVEDVVTVGSPHRGVPLERFVNAVVRRLGAGSATRPLANFLDTRSIGIKDLRYGTAIVGGKRTDSNPDDVLPAARGADELPAGIKAHFVAGVITSNPTHPFGLVIGDLMVPARSATRPHHLEPTTTAVFGGRHHFNLLHEPKVIKHVMGWLTARSEGRSG